MTDVPVTAEAPVSASAPVRPGAPSAYLTRDLTQGSIPRNLWFLAWPTMVSGLLQTADLVAELVWAGFLGYRAIASIGVAQS